MSTKVPKDGGLARDESRWLDGESDPRAAREVEERLAGDPARRERVAAWREAMGLWREDARRTSLPEPAVLADRVLRAPVPPPRVGGATPDEETRRSARRYAAAAVVLIGLGLAGSAWIGPRPAGADRSGEVRSAMRLLEEERIDLQVSMEWERFAPSGAPAPTGER